MKTERENILPPSNTMSSTTVNLGKLIWRHLIVFLFLHASCRLINLEMWQLHFWKKCQSWEQRHCTFTNQEHPVLSVSFKHVPSCTWQYCLLRSDICCFDGLELFFNALEGVFFPLKLTDVNETALQQPISQSFSGGMLYFKDYASVMNHTLNHVLVIAIINLQLQL